MQDRTGTPAPVPHEYLALNKMEIPPLPQRNQTMSNVYPPLPHQSPLRYTTTGSPRSLTRHPNAMRRWQNLSDDRSPKATDLQLDPWPAHPPVGVANDQIGPTPPAADDRPATALTTPTLPSTTNGLVGLPVSRTGGPSRPFENIFPKGPIGNVMKPRR